MVKMINVKPDALTSHSTWLIGLNDFSRDAVKRACLIFMCLTIFLTANESSAIEKLGNTQWQNEQKIPILGVTM
jgi:hypothetical protein